LENANAFPGPSGLLEHPDRGDHIALVYRDDDFLTESVRRFVDAGLDAREGIVVFATLPRWEAIRLRLAMAGVDVVGAAGRGQIMRLGVHNILLGWMSANCSQPAFNQEAGVMVDIQLGQYAAVRVYSELADTLLEKNSRMIAANMQRCWNAYLLDKPVSVLSAWPLNRLDAEGYRTRLESLYFSHKYVVAQSDPSGTGGPSFEPPPVRKDASE
jgi:hypothetical protein